MVFPRTAVEIHQADRPSVVATPNHAMLYNSHHPYRRDLIDPRGDVCEFYCVAPRLLEEVLKSLGAAVPERREAPFEVSHSPCSAAIYASQSALFRAIATREIEDPVFIEESFFELLPKLVRQAMDFSDPFSKRRKEPCPVRRDQVEAAKDFISRNFQTRLTVSQIAQYVDCSVFHLCRIFKKFTGQSIHAFVLQFRLRTAFERVMDDDDSLTDIALDLCFSSHSHFTNAFRQRFGSCPSRLRQSSYRNSYKLLNSPLAH